MILKFLRKLGLGSDGDIPNEGEAVEYNGYTIVPSPEKDGSAWRVQGSISKEVEGERQTHRFIRADTYPGRDDALSMTVSKAKRIIDEQGDRMFR